MGKCRSITHLVLSRLRNHSPLRRRRWDTWIVHNAFLRSTIRAASLAGRKRCMCDQTFRIGYADTTFTVFVTARTSASRTRITFSRGARSRHAQPVFRQISAQDRFQEQRENKLLRNGAASKSLDGAPRKEVIYQRLFSASTLRRGARAQAAARCVTASYERQLNDAGGSERGSRRGSTGHKKEKPRVRRRSERCQHRRPRGGPVTHRIAGGCSVCENTVLI